MKLQAIVLYKGEPARYTIVAEYRGIYQARLLEYKGKGGEAPPENILLMKGVRH